VECIGTRLRNVSYAAQCGKVTLSLSTAKANGNDKTDNVKTKEFRS
jgi:hypothetical protein